MADRNNAPRSSRLFSSVNPETRQSSRSMKEQTVKLIDMTAKYVLKREDKCKLEIFVFHLKSQRLRNSANSTTFYRNGGVDSLLQLSRSLQKNDEEDSSLLSLVWGTLANVCALDERTHQKVVLALNDICDILINCPFPKVLNTVCRTLGNITTCLVYNGNEIIIIREITRIITTYEDDGCLQSALRTLRKLSPNGEMNDELKLSQTIRVITNILDLKHHHISVAALNTLETITSNCDLIPDLWSPDNIPLQRLVQFVKLASNGVNTILLDMSIIILCKCAHHADGKSALSRAGGIEVMVEILVSSPRDYSLYRDILDALCTCCRDVHGRQRMRDSSGLQLLIELVHDDTFNGLCHENIISALICYYFDEHTLRYMVRQLNLMKSLVFHLVKITEQSKSSICNNDENINESSSDVIDTISLSAMDSISRDRPSPLSSISCDSFQSMADNTDSLSEDILLNDSTQPLHNEYSPSYNPLTIQPTSNDSITDASTSNIQPTVDDSNIITNTSTSLNILPTVNDTNSIADTSTGLNILPIIDDSNSTITDCTSLNIFVKDDDFIRTCSSLATPPSKKVAISIVDSSTPIPANFIDSLLSSPTPYSSSSLPIIPTQSLLSDHSQESLESKILLLISRLSHLQDCQPILAISETLSTILQYYLASTGANNIQSYKILSRIFINPICFQNCIITHAPSIVFKQIYPANKNPPSSNSSHAFDIHSSCSNMCNELFNNLCRVAESPYGQGVVAHMLLRGNEEEITAGTLALSLFQKSHVVCHRMLTSYNGLHNLFSLVQGIPIIPPRDATLRNVTPGPIDATPIDTTPIDATPRDSTRDPGDALVSLPNYYTAMQVVLQDSAIITILYLANLYHTQQRLKRQRTYSTTCLEEPVVYSISPPMKKQRLETTVDTTRDVYTAAVSNHHCCYSDTDHYPFDLVVMVENSLGGAVRPFPVHRNLLVETCQVFARMLEGLYQESKLDKIHLYELSPAVFSSYIHHIYGCCWPCNKDLELTATSIEELTLIREIVKFIDVDKHSIVVHYLLLLECANRYYLPSLVTLCENELGPIVTEDNLVPMFMYSCMYNSNQLSKKCIVLLASVRDVEIQCAMMRELLESMDSSNCLEIIREMFYN